MDDPLSSVLSMCLCGYLALCYNGLASAQFSRSLRKWWNWQTHHLEGVAPKGMGVQVPPSAPSILANIAVSEG